MDIKRQNVDFGNSIFQTLVDGYYYEIPTNVVEITKDQAEGHFPSSVNEPELLLQNLLISTTIEGVEKYYLVGDAAEKHVLGNIHINKLHNKTESDIPYVTFLASVAYYNILKGKDKEDNHVTINYFSTMLPIWLLKKTNKFSEMQQKMAEHFETLIVDLGGGTVDLALLPAGLQAPKSRNSLKCLTDISYLKHIEKLRNEKLLEYFDDVRSLEEFIIANIHKAKMEQRDGNSGKKVDLTEPIHASLREYTQILLTKVENLFPSPKDKVYKYIYIGGLAPILQQFIAEQIDNMYGEEIREENHLFLPETRKLNLYGLEILSRHETNAVHV